MEREDEVEQLSELGASRRNFLTQLTVAGAGLSFAPYLPKSESKKPGSRLTIIQPVNLNIIINGSRRSLNIDPRTTLLDALRNNLKMPGTKKGCDHGQCGACTVLLNNRRVNSCLILAAMCDSNEVTTVEGLAKGDELLHPMQAAFVKHDAFQCGYCTPGQICSAIGLIKEGHAKSDAEIRELMSGNICRCGAYQNILEAIKEVQTV